MANKATECWVVFEGEGHCFAGIVMSDWDHPPRYNTTNGEQRFDMSMRFYKGDHAVDILNISVPDGHRQRAMITKLTFAQGVEIRLYGEPEKP